MIALVTMPLGRRLGGSEQMIWTLLRHVDRSRLEPRVVFLERGPFEREVAALGLMTHVVEAGRLRQPAMLAGAVAALAGLVRRERPDVVLNWSSKAQVYGGLADRLAGRVPVVWWQHGIPDGHWLDRVATALPASAVGCSSNACAAAQRRLRPRRATFVVHPGIELPALPTADERETVRAQLGIPADRVVVGIVGRLQPWKGQDRVLRALALLHRDGLPMHGLVVGGDAYELSPDYAASLPALVARLGLEGHVTLTGQVRDAARLMAGMDVLVNASDSEPFGIVLLESMGRGIPTVAVDVGGPREIVEDDRSGLLLSNRMAGSIADAVRRLAVDSHLRERVSRGGREQVESRFTAERMAERFQTELERIVERADA